MGTPSGIFTAGQKIAILQLTWDRVDFERRQIRLAVVGDRNRKGRALVPMTDRLFAELQAAKQAALSPYFVEYAGGQVLDIKKGFASAVARAGLGDVTPHDLRHSAAVWMAESGVPMDEIAQFLGHSDPESLTGYMPVSATNTCASRLQRSTSEHVRFN
jgi:integrase